jgi:hypothetical protein
MHGAIPPAPPSMVYLHLGNNSFGGAAPGASVDHNLTYINLDDNKLSTLPDVFAAPRAVFLSIARNRLNGTLPNLGNYTPSLVYCDLNGNMLSGSVDVQYGAQNWSYLALDNNTLSGVMPKVWTANVSVLLLQNNRIGGCLPESWATNASLTVLELSNNSLVCPGGLPVSWANSSSFQSLKILSLQGNTGLTRNPVPNAWFAQGSFQDDTNLRLGNLWKSSAASCTWRKQVCIKRILHDRLQTQLSATVSRTILEAVQASLDATLAMSTDGVAQPAVDTFVPSLDVGSADLRLDDALPPALEDICGNPRALLVVVVQWALLCVCLLLLMAVYGLETKWSLWSRLFESVGACRGKSSSRGSRLSKAIRKLVVLRHLVGLLFYWFDIVLDVILLHEVLAVGASLGYGLLVVLLTHYIVMAKLVAWRCITASTVWRLLATLLALLLAPLMPLLDSITFLAVMTLQLFQGAPTLLSHRSWLAKLDARSEDWMVLFESREVLEVVLEAIPTAVLQSVVFVAGNSPHLGIYLDKTLYMLSSAGSCMQILRLTALVMWAAASQRKSVWGVLMDRLSVKGSHRETSSQVSRSSAAALMPTTSLDGKLVP